MTDKTRVAAEARRLLLREYHGVLSTHSVEAPGYPFGSVAPYCLNRAGEPVILISRIAQHTRNIEANAKVSLIVTEDEAADVQAAARLTLLARATRVAEGVDEIAARYYAYFPAARDYHATHDFDFYRLDPQQARYIGGFGEIHWLEPAALMLANPFTQEEEGRMVAHMNADHVDAMRLYCRQAGVSVETHEPSMAGVDAEGFHLRLGARIVRFEFAQPVATPGAVRAALVALAREV
ncbi:MAG: HugZ family protein [Gammaproteobacteria bacterium]